MNEPRNHELLREIDRLKRKCNDLREILAWLSDEYAVIAGYLPAIDDYEEELEDRRRYEEALSEQYRGEYL